MRSVKPGMVYEIFGRKGKKEKKSLAADFASSDNPLKYFRLRSTFLSKLNSTWLVSPVTTANFAGRNR